MNGERVGAGKSDGRPKVLLIDDDAGVLVRLRDYLEAKGCAVTFSESIFQIPSIVRRVQPNAVVLDIHMPALNGDGVATTLQSICDVPIIFYSAVMPDEGAALARQHKASFVSKAQGVRPLYERLMSELRAHSETRKADGM